MQTFFQLVKCFLLDFLRGAKHSKASKIALIFAFCYLFIFSGVTVVFLTLGIAPTFIAGSNSAQFLGLILLVTQVVLLIFMLAYLISALYFSKDYELLLTFPLNANVVLFAKLFIAYLICILLSAVIVLSGGITFGVLMGAGAWFYILLTLSIFVVPILPLFSATLILMVLMPIINKLLKYKALLTSILVAFIVGALYLYFKIFTSDIFVMGESITISDAAMNIINTIFNVVFFDKALASILMGDNVSINASILIGMMTLLIGAIWLLSRFLYLKQVQNSLENESLRLTSKLPLGLSIYRTLLFREFLTIGRFTSLILYCSVGLIMAPLIIIFYTSLLPPMDTFLTGIIMLSFIIFLNGAMQLFALSSFTREGEVLSSLKALPLSDGLVCKVKFHFALIILGVSLLLSYIVLFIFVDLPIWLYLFIIVTSMLVCFANCCLCLVCDAQSPRLKWNNISSAMQNNINSLKVLAFSSLIIALEFGWLLLNTYVFKLAGTMLMLSECIFIFVLAVSMALLMYIMYRKKCHLYYQNIEV